MHSKSTDFIEDENADEQKRLPVKQFGGMHRAGGSQFKNWSLQTA